MADTVSRVMDIGPYRGELVSEYRSERMLSQVRRLPKLLATEEAVTLTDGRNRNVRVHLDTPGGAIDVAVKRFGRQSLPKDQHDRRHGTKAYRTWRAATLLAEKGVGTPEPIGYLERWSSGRLVESYYLARYIGDIGNFRDELARLFEHDPECARFMSLLRTVAEAVRAMHAAGFQHNDLGNQNILLRRVGEDAWKDVHFVDLNRGRIRGELGVRQRARDLSRIYLPSDLLRVFCEMYYGDIVPAAFKRWERFYRAAYRLHSVTRPLRHPFREGRQRRSGGGGPVYPSEKDMWIWDERSAQAISAMRSRDRRRYYPPTRHVRIAVAALCCAAPVWRAYRKLKQECFARPVDLSGRIGVGVNPRPETWDREREYLEALGNVPVNIRFYHHESMWEWNYLSGVVRELADAGRGVSIALVQDRRAVLDPGRWAAFATHVLHRVGDCVQGVEVGHAINRVKWGIWDYREYGDLLRALASVSDWHADVRYTGPAVIDFEYPDVLTALRHLPEGLRFSALSHHLYVDRRGAPENRQGPFAALEKFALARAIARCSPVCEDRLVVSEVNWPLLGTGVYSPVGSPYVSPGPRFNDPSVSEDVYAEYMIRYLVTALCSGMVDTVFWWRLVARGFGLIDDSEPGDWRERPAYGMLRTFLNTLGEGRFLRKLETHDGTDRYLFEQPGGTQCVLAYVRGPEPIAVSLDGMRAATDALGVPLPLDQPCKLEGRPVFLFPE